LREKNLQGGVVDTCPIIAAILLDPSLWFPPTYP
jgi:hypothetical protein